MKKLNLLLIFLIAFTFQAISQEFEVPKDYKLDKADDYAQYEQDVIDGVTWMIETPITQEVDKRRDAGKFLLIWMMGSPTVNIMLNPDIITFIDNGDLLFAFMGGWTKYVLESKDFKSEFNGSMAGINNVISFYTKNKAAIGKVKAVEKYIKLKAKGKLESTIKSRII
jgi:hypothetical protein